MVTTKIKFQEKSLDAAQSLCVSFLSAAAAAAAAASPSRLWEVQDNCVHYQHHLSGNTTRGTPLPLVA